MPLKSYWVQTSEREKARTGSGGKPIGRKILPTTSRPEARYQWGGGKTSPERRKRTGERRKGKRNKSQFLGDSSGSQPWQALRKANFVGHLLGPEHRDLSDPRGAKK